MLTKENLLDLHKEFHKYCQSRLGDGGCFGCKIANEGYTKSECFAHFLSNKIDENMIETVLVESAQSQDRLHDNIYSEQLKYGSLILI